MPLTKLSTYLRAKHSHRAKAFSMTAAIVVTACVVVVWVVSLRFSSLKESGNPNIVNPFGASVSEIGKLGKEIGKDFSLLSNVFNEGTVENK